VITYTIIIIYVITYAINKKTFLTFFYSCHVRYVVNVFSYFPNVYKQIIVKKRSSLQRFFKDDIRKLADLKQQISQQMILRLQQAHRQNAKVLRT